MMSHMLAFHLTFLSVAARKADQIKVLSVQKVKADGHNFFNMDRSLPAINNLNRTGDDICFFKHAVQENHLNITYFVA